MRLAPIGALSMPLDFSTSHTVQKHQRGMVLAAAPTDWDTTANVANWGSCELIYTGSVDAAAILPGSVVVMSGTRQRATLSAAAASVVSGGSCFIAVTNFAIGSTDEQFGWVLQSGMCPVTFSVAATTGAVYAGTAGNLTPSQANGKQVNNAQTLIAAVTTFTKTGKTQTGSSVVKVASVGGMYPGQAISGTGIPASSVISSLGADGQSVLIGSAIGTLVTATASASVTCTFTNTGYGIVRVNRPFFQGQIV